MFLFARVGAAAEELVLRLEPIGEPVSSPQVEVEVSPRSAQQAAPVQRRVRAPAVLHVPGLAPGLWAVRAAADGWWAPDQVLEIAGGGANNEPPDLTIRLWPTATVSGSVKVGGGPGLGEMHVRFQPVAPERHENPVPPEGKVGCRLDEGRFACILPAGRWDLRLAAPNYARHYLWQREAAAGGTLDLGELTFVAGASVVGRAPACAEPPPDPACRLTLEPWTPAAPRNERQLAAQRLEAAADRHGFFQFQGVPAGAHLLTVEKAGYAPERVYPVRVFEGAESELALPVTLRPPGDLEVTIHPPRGPAGDPWSIELRELGMGGTGRLVARDTASGEGLWRRPGLTPGAHRVALADARGNRWIDQEVEVGSGSNQVTVTAPLVLVEGAVRFGEQPVPGAEIWFGGPHHRLRVRTWTDDDGEYATHLARPGVWPVQLRSADGAIRRWMQRVEVPEGGGRLDFELPDTELTGTVVDPERRPVEGAAVLVAALDHLETVPDVTTDEEGRFRVLGFDYGGVALGAQLGELQSDEVRVELTEGAPTAEVHLVLQRLREVEGRVVSPEGRGVPGALIDWNATGSPRSAQAFSAADGGFSLSLPAEVREVDLRLLPPGYSFSVRRVTVGEGPLVVVVDDLSSTLVLEPRGDRMAELVPELGGSVLFFRGPAFFTLAELHRWMTLQRSLADLPADGFVIPGIEPGELTACVIADGQLWSLSRYGDRGGGRCLTVDLPIGGAATLDLRDLAPPRVPAAVAGAGAQRP